MKKIRVEDAVGTILAHDLTRILRGKFKGVGFHKGHIVQEKDIPELLKIGKHYLYVLDLGKDQLHEDDAAIRIARAISAKGLDFSEPREGKINITTPYAGLVKINVDALLRVNKMESIIVATLKNNFPCKKGEIIAATRIIPLTIATKNIEVLEALAKEQETIISLKPYKSLKVGAVVTGSEVYNGLIEDDFDPSVGNKITQAGCRLTKKIIVPDDVAAISKAIQELNRNLSQEGQLSFVLSSNQIMCELNNVTIISRLIEGEFPDYQQVIPAAASHIIKVDRQQFLSAFRLSASVAE